MFATILILSMVCSRPRNLRPTELFDVLFTVQCVSQSLFAVVGNPKKPTKVSVANSKTTKLTL